MNSTPLTLASWQRDKNLLGSVCSKNNFLWGRLSCLKGSTSSSLQKLWISDTIFPHRKVCVRKRSLAVPAFTFWILRVFYGSLSSSEAKWTWSAWPDSTRIWTLGAQTDPKSGSNRVHSDLLRHSRVEPYLRPTWPWGPTRPNSTRILGPKSSSTRKNGSGLATLQSRGGNYGALAFGAALLLDVELRKFTSRYVW